VHWYISKIYTKLTHHAAVVQAIAFLICSSTSLALAGMAGATQPSDLSCPSADIDRRDLAVAAADGVIQRFWTGQPQCCNPMGQWPTKTVMFQHDL
jgi:hypothetical protein